ncbi:MAG: SMP-30/gluconolactonase/LRE family protein [Bryobacteraceae bacterium]|jgi:gluconolactonase
MNRAARIVPAAAVAALFVFAQDFSSVTIQKLAEGYQFTEGPVWSKDGFLVFSDTPSDRLIKWISGRAAEALRADAHGPSGNAFDSQGRLYTCETRERRVVRADKDKIEVVADRWEGKRLNAPNDIVVSANGHVYFTDPAFGGQDDRRELDFYGVYHVPPKGPMTLVAKPAGRPKGIALSPNGRVLYVGNADEHNVRAYDVARDGATSNERLLISGIAGVPGGICVDLQGNLFVAADGVAIYTPQGRLLHVLEVNHRVSNCSFGGMDSRFLFLTEGSAVYRVHLDAKGAN